jgi:putative ABC transport system ATP-binding protein
MANSALIEVASLLFRWPGASSPCLDIESLSIDAGQRVFLFGPSGSGKSTLLALLAGVMTAERGSVRVLGTELSSLKARDRFRVEHVGFIFQQFNLVPYLSVVQNVLLPCRFSARRAQRATEAHGSPMDAATHLLDAMGLGAALRKRKATELSVGQQQRVAAARALIGAPELIIADEPTSSLDADARQAFLELLESQCDRFGSTLLFVSHDRQLAATFDRQVDLPAINRVVPDGSTP